MTRGTESGGTVRVSSPWISSFVWACFCLFLWPARGDVSVVDPSDDRIITKDRLQAYPAWQLLRAGPSGGTFCVDERCVDGRGVSHVAFCSRNGIAYMNDRHPSRTQSGYSNLFQVSTGNDSGAAIATDRSGAKIAVGWRRSASSGHALFFRIKTPVMWMPEFPFLQSATSGEVYSLRDMAVDEQGRIHVLIEHKTGTLANPSTDPPRYTQSTVELLHSRDFGAPSVVSGTTFSYISDQRLNARLVFSNSGNVFALWERLYAVASFNEYTEKQGGITRNGSVVIFTGLVAGGAVDSQDMLHFLYVDGANGIRYRHPGGSDEPTHFAFGAGLRTRLFVDTFDRLDMVHSTPVFARRHNSSLLPGGSPDDSPWVKVTRPTEDHLREDIREYNLGTNLDPATLVPLGQGLTANVANGNLTYVLPLFADKGRGFSADVRLFYNSKGDDEGPLGRGWTHFYEWVLTHDVRDSTKTAPYEMRFPDGRRVIYKRASVSNNYLPANEYGESSYIVRNPATETATLVLKNGTQVSFNTRGQPVEIRDTKASPNTLTLAYGDNPTAGDLTERELGQAASLLLSITDSVGRVTGFEYDVLNRLAKVVRDSGDAWAVFYDAAGRMKEVLYDPRTNDLPHVLKWQFGYHDASDRTAGFFKDLLASVKTPRGAAGNYAIEILYTPDRDVRAVQFPEDPYVPEGGGNPVSARPTWGFEYEHPVIERNPGAIPRTKVTGPRGSTTGLATDFITAYEHQYRRGIATKRTDPAGNAETWLYDGSVGFPRCRNPDFYQDRRGEITGFLFFPPTTSSSPTTPYAVDNLQQRARFGPPHAVTSWTYTDYNRIDTVTDPRGNTTDHDYDGAGNLRFVRHPSTPRIAPDGVEEPSFIAVEEMRYDASGRITRRIAPEGGETVYGYGDPGLDPGGTGLPTSVLRPDHAAPDLTRYDPLGLGYVVGTQPAGPGLGETTFLLDGAWRVKERREPPVAPAGASDTTFEYDADSNLVRTTDPRGNPTVFTVNRMDLRTAVTNAAGDSAATGYDVAGNVRRSTDFRGNLSTFAYDATGRLDVQVLPGPPARETRFDYDGEGNLTFLTEIGDGADPTRVTEHRYDTRGNRTHVIRPDGTVDIGAWDLSDNLLDTARFAGVDGNGNGLNFSSGNAWAYDARNRRAAMVRIETYSPGAHVGPTTLYGLDGNSNLRVAIDPDGVKSIAVFDRADRPVLALASDTRLLRRATWTDDDQADKVYVPKPSLASPILVPDPTVYSFNPSDYVASADSDYDAQGRLARVTDDSGLFTETVHDAADNVDTVTDRRGFSKTWQYDVLNRPDLLVEQVAAGQTLTTVFHYDDDSNLDQVTDPRTLVYDLEYDEGGRLKKLRYPLVTGQGARTEETWVYTSHGQMRTHVDGGANARTVVYDVVGRPLDETVTGGSGSRHVVRAWDAADNLTRIQDLVTGSEIRYGVLSGGQVTGGYDPLNRPLLAAYVQGGMTLKEVATAWTPGSRRDLVTGTDGDQAKYVHNANGLLDEIRYKLPSGGVIPQERQTYDAALRPLAVEDLVSGIIRTRSYDNRELLSAIETKQGAAVLSRLDFARDGEGNLSAKTTRLGGEVTAVGYTHDGLGRLKSENWYGATGYCGIYGYDPAGNRNVKDVVTGSALESWDMTFDEGNRLVQTLVGSAPFVQLTPSGTAVSSTEAGFSQAVLTDGDTSDTLNPAQTWASLDQATTHFAELDLGSVQFVAQVKVSLPTGNGLFQRFKVQYFNGSSYLDLPAGAVAGALPSSTSGWYTNVQHDVAFACTGVLTQKIRFVMDAGGGAPSDPNQAYLNEIRACILGASTLQQSITYGVDGAGNRVSQSDVVSGQLEIFGFDGFNRYESYTRSGGAGSAAVSYLHTPQGDRLARMPTVGEPVINTWYINDGSDVTADYTGSPGSLSPSLFYLNGLGVDDKRLRFSPGGTRHLYNTDHLGTPLQILDNAGAEAKRLTQNAWGEPIIGIAPLRVGGSSGPGGRLRPGSGAGGSITDRYDFTQRERDFESSLINFRPRMYDPRTGTFIQKDPVLANRVFPVAYQFVGNSPTDAIDPFGTDRTFVRGGKAYWQVQSEGFLWDSDVGSPHEIGALKSGLVYLNKDFGGGTLFERDFLQAGENFWPLGFPDISKLGADLQKQRIGAGLARFIRTGGATFAQMHPYATAYAEGATIGSYAYVESFTLGFEQAPESVRRTQEFRSAKLATDPAAALFYGTLAATAAPAGAKLAGALITGGAVGVPAQGGASRGVGPITGYTRHGLNQAISREGIGVSPRAILDAVKSPIEVLQRSGGITEYVGELARVRLNAAGEVITVIPRSSVGYRGVR